ncbi:MAG: hypothetical protein IJB98_03350 [Clostridia bacterium]|nr:hypothetical protein [Clostridia bacterium]
MAKPKRYYTQIEVDEYVRRLLTSSEITLSKQAERIEKERKENERLTKELEEYKNKEKSVSRLLVLSERKAKYLESTTRSRCAIEIERLAMLAEKWDAFFADLTNKYNFKDKEKLEEFKNELSQTIDNMLEMDGLFGDKPLDEAEQAQVGELNRLNVLRNKKKTELDDRFSKLVMEFNMKIGDNATRGRGRPKKQDSSKVGDIEKKLKPKTARQKSTVYPPKGESGFDFEEALNPTDSLEDIMKDLMG